MISINDIKQEKQQPRQPDAGEKPSVMRIIKPSIDLAVCEKNYNCVVFCPRNAISINQKSSPVINYDLCDGCLICLRECPTSAIIEERL